MARDDPTIYMRLPAGLKAQLEEAAEASRRSMTSEVVARLEQSFDANNEVDARRRLRVGVEGPATDPPSRHATPLSEVAPLLIAVAVRSMIESLPSSVRSEKKVRETYSLLSKVIHSGLGEEALSAAVSGLRTTSIRENQVDDERRASASEEVSSKSISQHRTTQADASPKTLTAERDGRQTPAVSKSARRK
jgi:hypothetical protein